MVYSINKYLDDLVFCCLILANRGYGLNGALGPSKAVSVSIDGFAVN